jgi:shikimate dehydrogenase
MSSKPSKQAKLGLIGDNIALSKAPHLHRVAGQLTGINVTYDRLVPKDMGLTFGEVFVHAQESGFRGVNVTYPYKEIVTDWLTVIGPLVKAIGAINTVRFDPDGPLGFNTDYTGFIRAYRAAMGETKPGVVCLIGTGGVGKAVAFALIALNADAVRCVDLDSEKAEGLADALVRLGSETQVGVWRDVTASATGADGIVNCTPLGMDGIGGTPLQTEAMTDAKWAFDAVYTPIETQFLWDAAQGGLKVISGYELFFGQGFDAWNIFMETPVDQTALREAINSTSEQNSQ